ncbi:hypothetical protein LPJ64_002365 [Coemansia asiatica]|uniref:Uncharacterized protein n=1 Tax=Coemansia asiatica TaxID=1052880 RepID=A0A9W7XN83_9FUNG|nr:hypothetical protein LPJ64_002365 [Coemansia asiatica]
MTTTTTTTTTATTAAIRQPLQHHALCLFSPTSDIPVATQPAAVVRSGTPALSTNPSSIGSTNSSGSLQRETSGATEHPDDSWPMAVEALAQRLWDCGRDALGGGRPQHQQEQQQQQQQHPKPLSAATTASSQLDFDAAPHTPTTATTAENNDSGDEDVPEDLLCDGPYVCIENWSHTTNSDKHKPAVAQMPLWPTKDNSGQWPQPTLIAESPGRPNDQSSDFSQRQQKHRPSHDIQLPQKKQHKHYYQRPMDNPFKTMLKQPSVSIHQQKPAYILTPYKSMPPTHGLQQCNGACVHCKQGNFLEFCFVSDRCVCSCHKVCPCKPCLDIRDQRKHARSAALDISFINAGGDGANNGNKRSAEFFSSHADSPPKVTKIWNDDSQHGLCFMAS